MTRATSEQTFDERTRDGGACLHGTLGADNTVRATFQLSKRAGVFVIDCRKIVMSFARARAPSVISPGECLHHGVTTRPCCPIRQSVSRDLRLSRFYRATPERRVEVGVSGKQRERIRGTARRHFVLIKGFRPGAVIYF